MDNLPGLGLDPIRYSVTELTRYLRGVLETDYRLQDVWVTGEISNLSQPSSGHLYFQLGDENASLRCVMWRDHVDRLEVVPGGGESVEVHGRIGIYEAGGQYQLYADDIRYAGEGEAYQAFLHLKRKLEAEGLFDPARKRSLPSFPQRIGIVTSATGAALQDALDVLERRYPLLQVLVSPSPVQGVEAPARLRAALHQFRSHPVDLILLVRGGGSVEDLAAFNDESLARAIVEAPAPVVTGVGHETDFTIADFVADLRAPTPSAAAELATPDRLELMRALADAHQALAGALSQKLAIELAAMGLLGQRLRSNSPQAQLDNERQRLDQAERRLLDSVGGQIRWLSAHLQGAVDTLRAVGPESVLGRGYAVVRDETGRIVRASGQLSTGAQVGVQLAEGGFSATVDELNDPAQADV